MDPLLECSQLYYKCEMRKVLVDLYKTRKEQPSNLGRLGPALFSPVRPFLKEALASSHFMPCISLIETKVVSFGDVHGDLLALLSVLFLLGVIDKDAHWIGKDTTVVQCGDFLDRAGREGVSVDTSKNSREEVDIVQYIYYLNIEAQKQGGRVVSVLGNHELFTVWPNEAYSNYHDHDQAFGWADTGDDLTLEQAVSQKLSLFAPGGLMAQYLSRFCPLILQINNFLFMHGGITEEIVTQFVGSEEWPHTVLVDMCEKMRGLLKTPNSPVDSALFEITQDRSLSQSRSASQTANKNCVDRVKALFDRLYLSFVRGGIVLGHTVQDTGIPYFCGGKVWRVDLGMSEGFGKMVSVRPLGGIIITFTKDTSIVERKHVFTMLDENVQSTKYHSVTYENGNYVSSQMFQQVESNNSNTDQDTPLLLQ